MHVNREDAPLSGAFSWPFLPQVFGAFPKPFVGVTSLYRAVCDLPLQASPGSALPLVGKSSLAHGISLSCTSPP